MITSSIPSLNQIQSRFTFIYGRILDQTHLSPVRQAEALAMIDNNASCAESIRQEYQERLTEMLYEWLQTHDDPLDRATIVEIRQNLLDAMAETYPDFDIPFIVGLMPPARGRQNRIW